VCTYLKTTETDLARPKTIEDADILRAAREVFIEGGALGSTREIARRMGVSEATLFKRFPTKTALFLAAMAPPPADTMNLLIKARAQKDTRKALQIIGELTLEYFRSAIPRMLPLITHPAIGIDELLQRFGESPASALNNAIAQYVAEQHDKGAIFAPKPMAVSGLIVATMHSVVLFELMGLHEGEIPHIAVNAMLDTLWRGIAPVASGRTPMKRTQSRRKKT
jgi:AcrR family transcriptional regulator